MNVKIGYINDVIVVRINYTIILSYYVKSKS